MDIQRSRAFAPAIKIVFYEWRLGTRNLDLYLSPDFICQPFICLLINTIKIVPMIITREPDGGAGTVSVRRSRFN